ncbi:MAG: hypothetical protein ABFS21_06325 [Actinomycetota bacterium]
MTSSDTSRFPTWIVVVAIILLSIPIVWALSTAMHIVAAMSIGGVLVVAGLVALFVWLKKRTDA